MVNCALDSPDLGVGLSVGLMGGFCSNDEEPGFRYAAVATMSFDDNPDLFIEEENYGEPETVPSREVMYASVSNGNFERKYYFRFFSNYSRGVPEFQRKFVTLGLLKI